MKPASYEVICDTPTLQYLHQLGLLDLLPRLAAKVTVPAAVADELREGLRRGWNGPRLENFPWLEVSAPLRGGEAAADLGLGPGESAALALARERPEAVVILDDAAARAQAAKERLRYTGTLGLLLDAKRAGLVEAVAPLMEKLLRAGFRAAPKTRAAILQAAGES